MSRRKPYQFNPPTDGRAIWRSLEEKNQSDAERKRAAEPEFSTPVAKLVQLGSSKPGKSGGVGRREFVTLSSAAAGAVALGGCIRRPEENILPYARMPEHVSPGVPNHFATTLVSRGEAIGALVTSNEGRPTKVEGNVEHPASMGATDTLMQASVMDLYDPHRAMQVSTRSGDAMDASTWEALEAVLRAAGQGSKTRVLSAATTSPSFVRLKRQLSGVRFHNYETLNNANMREGARLAFGKPLMPFYDFSEVLTVVSVDSDFLGGDVGSVRNAKTFSNRRAISSPRDKMNRLYAVEATFSITGAHADHRLRMPSAACGTFLRALAGKLASAHGAANLGPFAEGADASAFDASWLEACAKDLADNRGKSLVVVGPRQPAWVHALGNAINETLGSVGTGVAYFPGLEEEITAEVDDLKQLTDDIRGGQVDTLVILGGNPVYDAPVDVDFAGALGTAGLTTVYVGQGLNATALASNWAAPLAHPLEAWGDHVSIAGIRSLQQPLIAPLWGGRSEIEVLAIMAGVSNWRGHFLVKSTMQAGGGVSGFSGEWRRALHRGVIGGGFGRAEAVTVNAAGITSAISAAGAAPTIGRDNIEAVFTSGRFNGGSSANNPWLNELPDPITKIVWENAALMSPATASALGLENEDLIEVSIDGAGKTQLGVWVLPGHADFSVSLELGWGRPSAGKYANTRDGSPIGGNVQQLRTTTGFHSAAGLKITKVGETTIVQTQTHGNMEGRAIAIDMDHAEYRRRPEEASYRTVELSIPPLWDEVDYSEGHKWGMSIDLTSCTGCNTCVIACQAENNIPVVGKMEVQRGREMAWLRIDRYFMGDAEDPQIAIQPVGCQHCEEAPCENVCPVNATAHSPEGLNDMAYNRCIGTRYCANNCPYKVRRFNYLDWHGRNPHEGGGVPMETETLVQGETTTMQYNPNVTVRMRGVMEKCSYCVQRIQTAKIRAKVSGRRRVRDGEVITACQQACPSGAITFGDLNDPNSAVRKRSSLDRSYKLLAEIGTQPRTTYLAKIRNPNPALSNPAGSAAAADAHEGEAH